uniref:Uncharacterized protein n=1 Tax=Sipha flava TaxID=143950 RepID=A0A2S2PXU4_9HEMI
MGFEIMRKENCKQIFIFKVYRCDKRHARSVYSSFSCHRTFDRFIFPLRDLNAVFEKFTFVSRIFPGFASFTTGFRKKVQHVSRIEYYCFALKFQITTTPLAAENISLDQGVTAW